MKRSITKLLFRHNFAFGFGLSYTEFSYSGLTVTEKEARFTLTNTGDLDGAEIAELYVHAKKPSGYRPVSYFHAGRISDGAV